MNQGLTHFFQILGRRTAWMRTGTGLVILAVALVGLRWRWVRFQQPAHLAENADAYGSIRNFYGAVRMNHSGSQFIFAATADDRGRALFLGDTATGKKLQIIEDKQGVGFFQDDYKIGVGPWSPDDSCFLCVASNRLTICSPDPRQETVVLDDRPYSEAVWLAPTEIAYVTDSTNLCLAKKRADGKWEIRFFLSRDATLTSLTAINPDEVAWLESRETICHVNVAADSLKGMAAAADARTAAPPTAGLVLRLDASRLRQPDGSSVLRLADLSVHQNDAVRNGTAPVFNGTNSLQALNGHGTVHFGWVDAVTNGTGLKTHGPIGISGTAARSVFVVMRHEANRAMMVNMGDTSAHGALFGLEWSERLFLPTGWWADNYANATSTNWNLLEVVYDGTTQKGYLNGLLTCTASAHLNTTERGVEIGFRDGSDAKAAEGDFAELLVYDRALSATERKQAEDYLGGKWLGRTSFSVPRPLVWYNPGLEGLTGMDYSQATRSLLLGRTESGQDSVWWLDTTVGTNAVATQVMAGQSVRDAQWAGPNRFVYSSYLDGRSRIMLADLAGNDSKTLLQLWGNGTFDWFKMTPDQKQLFMYGMVSNAAAAGIWRNDLASDTWQPVISSSDYPANARAVVKLRSSVVTPAGNRNYTLYRPANFNPHNKYPFVLGDTQVDDPSHGEVFMTGLAACGACVAVVERPYWQFQLGEWETNVMALYRSLAADSSFDPARVYVFGQSAETEYMSRVLERSPGLWNGAIFLNPSELPDFSKSPRFQSRPKIYIDAGGEEHEEKRLKQYQTTAFGSGAVMEFYTYPEDNHRIVSSAARLERARMVARFVFEE